MTKLLTFLYGALCYALFLVSFLYAVGFMAGIVVPTPIDGVARGTFWHSASIDLALLGLFAIQHSVMARPAFKAWWTTIVPKSVERSTYVLISSLLLLLLTTQWQPQPQSVWSVENPAARAVLSALFWSGWLLVLLSTFLINHFDLFGLRQVYLYLRGAPYRELPFVYASLYRIVRHPLMLGFLIAFWTTPRMSVGHLLFSVAVTGYILVGVWLEERDLVRAHGDAYREYQRSVAMFIPFLGRTRPARHQEPDMSAARRL
jgi:protein-S-isoprenylcysteine O-methyltransferase Ste14